MKVELGPYVVWVNYGAEGWHPFSYSDLKAALESYRHSNDFVVTKLVKYEVTEQEAAE